MKDFEQFKAILDVIEVKAQTRIAENEDDAKLRRFKDKWMFMVTLIVIVVSLAAWILFIALHPDSPHLPIVFNAAFGLVMGLCGYYVKEKQSR